MFRRTFLLAAAFAIAGPALAAGEQPVDIVTRIYKLSAGKNGDYSGESAFNDKGVRAKYFSRSLAAALVKMIKNQRPPTSLSLISIRSVLRRTRPSSG